MNFALQSGTLPRKVFAMSIRSEAEENLRVIRNLMEKATIYRAISAPTALVGGLCSIAFGAWLYFRWRPLPAGREVVEFWTLFLRGWLSVFVLTVFANGLLIWRAARSRNEPFISPAMRKALWALLPPMLCGGFFTGMLSFVESESARWALPPLWMVFYGLGLLATAHFAPRSIPILGWCFLAAGLSSFGANYWLELVRMFGKGETHIPTAANLLMTATFGVFHIIYAACTWPRKAAVGS